MTQIIQDGDQPTANQIPKAYSINTFCRLFSVGRTLTYAEIKAGRLKIAKIGRRTVIPATEADKWFQQKILTENTVLS